MIGRWRIAGDGIVSAGDCIGTANRFTSG